MKTKVNNFSIYLRPLIYIALTVYFAISLQIWEMIVVLFTFILGRLVGGELNLNMVVTKRAGKVNYNRHPIIFGVWVVAIVVRIFVEFFYNVEIAIFLMTSLLSFSTGMLVSESRLLHIIIKRRKKRSPWWPL
jgi:hypothetical protein